MRFTGNGNVGSNPTLSARFILSYWLTLRLGRLGYLVHFEAEQTTAQIP